LVKSQRRRHLVTKAVGKWTNASVSHAFQMWADALEREMGRQQIKGSFAPGSTGLPTTQFSARRGQTPITEFSSRKHTPSQTPDMGFTFRKQTPITEFSSRKGKGSDGLFGVQENHLMGKNGLSLLGVFGFNQELNLM